MVTRHAAGRITLLMALAAVLLAVGCAQHRASEPTTPARSATPAPATQSATQVTPSPSPSPEATSTTPVEPAIPQPCSDADLTVTAGPVESVDTMRRVVISFTNTSPELCYLTGYPAADLVTGGGGVLVRVAKRPANAAPRLELHPGEVGSADVQTSAVDTATGDPCGRIGTLVVTPPNNVESRLLEINVPICDATISSVG
ncbi:Uncharacterised protein [Mycolicibacterium aurum]|uniref:DUF4232 domain-containing protein n=1 Tax=Mycolicibacterium aurum TaxID=1791 RepID=A0A448IY87_MYCAU|nr:DUF4232 domain-containing protein [Mycolicibacterium aurum]VEG57412.1 Uncharacterised protein [Mycolicibacterium aurum]